MAKVSRKTINNSAFRAWLLKTFGAEKVAIQRDGQIWLGYAEKTETGHKKSEYLEEDVYELLERFREEGGRG